MKIKYRPEIDGLRAVAVVAVIFYHAKIFINNKEILQGGFLGVDIFFVISGYLITSLILKEIKNTNNFSFINFYERRVRRILPVLLFIMIFSLPFSWFYLLPTDLEDFSKSILFSIGFSSNLYFYFTGQIYGATDSLLKPFLHTWSLSIEEQYYLIFPLFLILSHKYFKNFLIPLVILFLLSLMISSFTSLISSDYSFYFLHTRMWEILAGSILAYIEIKNKTRKKFNNEYVNQLLPLIGLIIIFHSYLIFNDKKTLHPSYFTLYPIIGTCLIVWFSNNKDIVGKILSSKIFVWTGLVSYSLYLWHFPVFALFRYSLASGSILKKGLLVCFIVLASITTYIFIEKPFRNKKIINIKKLTFFLVTLILVIFSINSYIIFNDGFKERFKLNKINLDNGFYLNERQNYLNNSKTKNFKSKKIKVLIVGNSHADDFFNIMNQNQEIFNDYEFKIFSTDIRCLFTFFDKNLLCKEEADLQNIKDFEKSDIILISTRWSNLDIKEDELNHILQNLKKQKKKIIITTSAPEFTTYGRFTILDKFILKNNRFPNEDEIKKLKKEFFNDQENNERIKSINSFLKSFAEKNNIKILEKKFYHCNYDKNECDFLTNKNEKIYYDRDHYTLAGSKYFGQKIKELNWLQIE